MEKDKQKKRKLTRTPKMILVFLCVVSCIVLSTFVIRTIVGDETIKDSIVVEDEQIEAASIPIDVEGMNQAILNYFEVQGIDSNNIAISYYNFETEDAYALNDDKFMFAASTYKLPLNMLIYDKYKEDTEANLTYCYTCYSGDGGSVEAGYYMGEKVPLNQLQYESIMNSDNTSSMILFEDLGGWFSFIDRTSEYVGHQVERYHTIENYYKSKDMIEVLKYLYSHEDNYSELLDNMKEAKQGQYFKKYVSYPTAHKYGEYDTVQNDVGIVYASNPYAIAVYTEYEFDGEEIVAQINKIICEYTDKA